MPPTISQTCCKLTEGDIITPLLSMHHGSEYESTGTVYVGLLTVQLYLMQSSQNLLAENFVRMTTVHPMMSIWPVPRMPPAVW